jgi:hypothetical protein
MKYAETTTVSSEKSRNEIERTLARFGAKGFLYGWLDKSALIMFEMDGRQIKFILPLPDRGLKEFTHTPNRSTLRTEKAANEAYEQAVRQKWRALALVIKAKLEAVESGITVFEDEFMAHIVLPDGQTVGSWMRPQIARAYEIGTMPALLPGLKS